ncbi:MAG: cell division protein FtsZ [Cyclobacteriaceae bacterium]|nr:cell division protein FtsZ [Cyclobacteriaceae bacterium]
MSLNTYKFEFPKHHKSIIKVIGVGGGGSNAVNHMFNQGIKDVEFIVCNTDSQALNNSPIPNRLQIGVHLTQGLGAGANPEVGKNAALENKEEIRELLQEDTRMVFITAGMGGGTGTGAAPVIARVAKELEILTVGIVTVPFGFEGKKKMEQAELGIQEMKENCDTVLVILNDKLREIHGNLAISEAFAKADNVLTTASKGIAEIITVPGYVNVDFEDVKTVMNDSGAAVMGSSTTEGENRARRAAEEAMSSPLLNNENIHGAQKILLSIISGEEAELQMDELTDITEYIQEMAGTDADVIFGHGVDPDLGESIRVTLIATGFDNNSGTLSLQPEKKVFDLESNKQIKLFDGFVKNNEQTESPIQPKKGYAFEGFSKPVENEKPEQNELEQPEEDQDQNVIEWDFDMETTSQTAEETEKHIESAFVPQQHSEAVENKRQMLQKQAEDRVNRLKGVSNPVTTDNFKEKLDVPAYLRKDVRLQDVPHSSEKNISKYHLNDDNQILGNNKYLHDNVD